MEPTRELKSPQLGRLANLIGKEDDEIGLVVDNRYRIARRIGRGGMGEVFLADDLRLNRPVAMKVLAANLPGNKLARFFEAEIRILAKIDHPSIVPIHDFGTLPDDRLYYIMKFVAGTTLAERITQGESRDRLLEILSRVCEVVQYTHDRGVIHRDLKPANIMVDGTGHVFVLDWGVAQVRKEISQTLRSQAAAGAPAVSKNLIVGTPDYMAPEQARGDRADGRCDVYSLGAILCEILTGAPPSGGADGTRPARLPSAALAAEARAILERSLRYAPEDRYPSATALKTDLDLLRRGESIPVRSARKRRRSILALVALAILLAGGGGLGVMWRRHTEEERQIQALRDEIDEAFRTALALRRAGRAAETSAFVARTREACARMIEKRPQSGEPHYRLGRLYAAQMRFPEALTEQDRALSKEPTLAAARLERGLLRFRSYEERIQELREDWRRLQGTVLQEEIQGASPSEVVLDPTAESWRRLALDDLDGLSSAVAHGVVAWLRGNAAEARRRFLQASQQEPERVESYEWLGRLSREEGNSQEAVDWYTKGLGIDAGYSPFLEGRGTAHLEEGMRTYRAGKDPSASLRSALEDFERLRGLDSESPRILLREGLAHMVGGGHERYRLRKDPRGRYGTAIGFFDRAVQRVPDSYAFLLLRGMAHLAWGEWEGAQGADPSERLDLALQDVERAEDLARTSWEPPYVRAAIRGSWMNYCLGRGRTPQERERAKELYAKIEEDVALASARNGAAVEPWILLGMCRQRQGDFRRAIESYESAIRLDSSTASRLSRRIEDCRRHLAPK